MDSRFIKSLHLILFTVYSHEMLSDFGLPIQKCTNLSGAGRGRRHVEEEASKEGAFRTHFTTDIIRRGRAIQTAINKHVEGDTISWPQEQLSLSPCQGC